VGYVFRANDAVEACGFHLLASEAEAGELRQAAAKLGDELCSIVIPAGLAGREKDARIGWYDNGTSVDFS
jgi:hypothetical protein